MFRGEFICAVRHAGAQSWRSLRQAEPPDIALEDARTQLRSDSATEAENSLLQCFNSLSSLGALTQKGQYGTAMWKILTAIDRSDLTFLDGAELTDSVEVKSDIAPQEPAVKDLRGLLHEVVLAAHDFIERETTGPSTPGV
jgi:hypothetical protein